MPDQYLLQEVLVCVRVCNCSSICYAASLGALCFIAMSRSPHVFVSKTYAHMNYPPRLVEQINASMEEHAALIQASQPSTPLSTPVKPSRGAGDQGGGLSNGSSNGGGPVEGLGGRNGSCAGLGNGNGPSRTSFCSSLPPTPPR
jgi:hypothetical protein